MIPDLDGLIRFCTKLERNIQPFTGSPTVGIIRETLIPGRYRSLPLVFQPADDGREVLHLLESGISRAVLDQYAAVVPGDPLAGVWVAYSAEAPSHLDRTMTKVSFVIAVDCGGRVVIVTRIADGRPKVEIHEDGGGSDSILGALRDVLLNLVANLPDWEADPIRISLVGRRK